MARDVREYPQILVIGLRVSSRWLLSTTPGGMT
jgi:hypothetical protein